MATDFTYNGKTITTSGGIKPSGKNTPADIRTRVNFKADISSIPSPFVGMHIVVLQDETNSNKMTEYVVKSLKANSLGIADTVIDEVVTLKEFLEVQEGAGEGIKGDKGDPGVTPNITIGTVITLPSGSNATVTKRGTLENPIFDFAIPKGADSANGNGNIKINKLLPDLNNVILTNAENYIDIPTYDGSNQCVHSKVLYFKNTWNGYKFWMAFTPLPYYPSVNENLENPSIVVSNDGVNWIVPEGLTNPLDNITELNKEYNSDTHLVMVNDTMEIWYRHFKDGLETIYKKTSTNGINWSERIKIMDSGASTREKFLSPVVLYDENKYKLWFVDYTTKSITYYESSNGVTFNKIRDIKLNIEDVWHIDIIKSKGKYILVGSVMNRQSCVYSESTDNINYTDCSTILYTSGASTNKWDSEHLYRPNLTEVDGDYYFYYTGRNDDVTGAKQGLIKIVGTEYPVTVSEFVLESDEKQFVSKALKEKLNAIDIYSILNRLSVLEKSLENGGTITPVTGITLDNTTLSLLKGDIQNLNATVEPSNATNQNITWKSDNESVAIVENGKVTAINVGSCKITATSYNNITATCSVVVNSNDNEEAIQYDFFINNSTPLAIDNEFPKDQFTVLKYTTSYNNTDYMLLGNSTTTEAMLYSNSDYISMNDFRTAVYNGQGSSIYTSKPVLRTEVSGNVLVIHIAIKNELLSSATLESAKQYLGLKPIGIKLVKKGTSVLNLPEVYPIVLNGYGVMDTASYYNATGLTAVYFDISNNYTFGDATQSKESFTCSFVPILTPNELKNSSDEGIVMQKEGSFNRVVVRLNNTRIGVTDDTIEKIRLIKICNYLLNNNILINKV